MTAENHENPDWSPNDLDLSKPSVARMYDYLLGGYHNFEIDRYYAEKSKELYPDIALASQVSRAFLRRTVRFLIDQGIIQFVDIGSGIPTVGHVHEILEEMEASGKVAYVDIDPVAVAHSNAILKDDPNAVAFQEDVRHPEAIYEELENTNIFDLEQPIALLFISMLHFVDDLDQLRDLVRRYRSRLAPGSYVAFTFGTYEGTPKEILDGIVKISAASSTKATYRTRDEILGIFDGLDFVEPGIVYNPQWRPDSPDDLFLDSPERSLSYAGVGLHS